MSDYHHRVRTVAAQLVGNNIHYHYDRSTPTPYRISECLDMSRKSLHLFDFKVNYCEGFRYSSYTFEDTSVTFEIAVKLTCDDGQTRIELARNDSFDFAGIMRMLLEA